MGRARCNLVQLRLVESDDSTRTIRTIDPFCVMTDQEVQDVECTREAFAHPLLDTVRAAGPPASREDFQL
jgi:hypothetical protein